MTEEVFQKMKFSTPELILNTRSIAICLDSFTSVSVELVTVDFDS